MKTQIIPILLFASYIAACSGHKQEKAAQTQGVDSLAAVPQQPGPSPSIEIHTDTLQFIHFNGDMDYWYAVFLNAQKDTVHLVSDDIVDDKWLHKLLAVRWRIDTLTQAGDNDSKYAAERMLDFKSVSGKPFVAPVSEAKVLRDIGNLVEVKQNADHVGIASRPSSLKPYYQVETSTRGEDNVSRLFSFRVYTYPAYAIKFYDLDNDRELSLEEWRSRP